MKNFNSLVLVGFLFATNAFAGRIEEFCYNGPFSTIRSEQLIGQPVLPELPSSGSVSYNGRLWGVGRVTFVAADAAVAPGGLSLSIERDTFVSSEAYEEAVAGRGRRVKSDRIVVIRAIDRDFSARYPQYTNGMLLALTCYRTELI